MALKWGIYSTGNMCSDFCTALKTLPESEHQIVAVVSRTKENGDKFASKYNIPKVYCSSEEFSKDPNIDIVYIGSIPKEHFTQTKSMLNAGKPVLCETPLAMTTPGIEELHKIADDKNLFLMEAMWSRCNPVYKKIKECIRNDDIGEVQMMRVAFNFNLDYSQFPPLSAFESTSVGMLHRIGIFAIQFALFVYGEMPSCIKADGDLIHNGYDIDGCIILVFSKGQKACLMYSSKAAMEGNGACIHGTKDCIALDTNFFWAPVEVNLPKEKFVLELPEGPYPCNYPNSIALRYEANEVRRCIQQGLTYCSDYTHEDSKMVHMVMDEVAKQIGLDLKHSF